MLILLIKTRLRYYRNYLRHHFDRAARIEVAIIVLIALYLTGRSPADIGYSLKFVQAPDFPQQFASAWVSLLPFFYLIVEGLALITLRPTGEWQMLGPLPLPKQVITNYHLLRHAGKSFLLLLIGTLPFYVGPSGLISKTLHFLSALGILSTLHIAGFWQAHAFRNASAKFLQRLLRWLPVEVLILSVTIASSLFLQKLFSPATLVALVGTVCAWGAFTIVLSGFYRRYLPGEREIAPARRRTITAIPWLRLDSGKKITGALNIRDLQFLWRQQRSTLFLVLFAIAMTAIPCIVSAKAEEVYASSAALQIIFSWLLINSLLSLFDNDAENLALTKSLPVTAGRLWWSRWLLAAAAIAVLMLIPFGVIVFKFSFDPGFLLFLLLALLLIPAIFATLYCNAGFGMFPQIKYSGVLLNLSLGMMVLFWFFMPIGTPLLLAVMLLWIRKSKKHFQFLEVT